MFRLVYISTARLDLKPQDLTDILNEATRTNAAHEVTGILLFNGLNFLQLLEGDKAAVEGIFSRILTDRRHATVTTVLTEKADSRLFPDWSMKLKRIPAIPEGPRMDNETFDNVFERDLPEHIERIFRNFDTLKG